MLITSQLTAQKKAANSNSKLSVPVHLGLEKEIKDKFKEFYNEQLVGHELILDKFYPIGWSKTGKFVYLVAPADEVCSCLMAIFVIQDLKTDRILWKYEYEGEPGTDERPEAFPAFWRAKQALFARKLKQYGVQSAKEFSLLSAPIRYQTDELIPRLEIIRTEQSEFDYPHNISRMLIKMSSRQKGEKLLFQKTFNEMEMFYGVIDAQLFGYLTSPFEPRVALVIVKVRRGWEGPPHATQTRIIGANLVNGFKK